MQLLKMYHKSDIEILIATMNQTNFDFLETMFLFSDFNKFNILIVNQTTENKVLHSNNERQVLQLCSSKTVFSNLEV